MREKSLFKSLAGGFLGLLFPEKVTCDICKNELCTEENPCPDCIAKIPFIHNPCCKCGCGVTDGNYCIRCKKTSFSFEKNIAVCDYDNYIMNILFQFKTGKKYLYKFISELMVKKLIKSGGIFEAIVYVPVTKKVFKSRGYNQSELIARHIGESLNLPVSDALVKIRETPFQKNCSAKERLKNLENAFAITDKAELKDKSILLIDDVITTGSTLLECSNTLLKNGAKNVTTCTFTAVKPLIHLE